MDFRGFDHTFLCEEPTALSKCEVSFAAQTSNSEHGGTETTFPAESGIERPSKKPKIQTQQKRFRMELKQKALALKHFDATVPKIKIRELAEWCKTTFRLDQAPKESTISLWFQPETRASLLHKLEAECYPHVVRQKSIIQYVIWKSKQSWLTGFMPCQWKTRKLS